MSSTHHTHHDPLSGHPGHLSESQEEALATFKKDLAAKGYYDPEKNPDITLLRFLRARKFDLPKSEEMWINCQNWRKEYNVDELYHTFNYTEKPEVDKIYPRFYHRVDNQFRPIYIEQLGNLDVSKLFKVTTPERQLQSLVVEYEKFQRERLPCCTAKAGHLIETSCTILDIKNVGLSQFFKVKKYIQEAAEISQNYYPESMGQFYIINAPWLFSQIWSVVKGWLDEATQQKIHVLDYKYEKELFKHMDRSAVPTFLGGTCDCPGGCASSDVGPWRGEDGKLLNAYDIPGYEEACTHA